jgi:hypothetical protein
MTFKPTSPRQLQFVPAMRASHNGLQNGEAEPVLYRASSRTPRPPPDKGERTLADVANPGQQRAENLGEPMVI